MAAAGAVDGVALELARELERAAGCVDDHAGEDGAAADLDVVVARDLRPGGSERERHEEGVVVEQMLTAQQEDQADWEELAHPEIDPTRPVTVRTYLPNDTGAAEKRRHRSLHAFSRR